MRPRPGKVVGGLGCKVWYRLGIGGGGEIWRSLNDHSMERSLTDSKQRGWTLIYPLCSKQCDGWMGSLVVKGMIPWTIVEKP